MPLVYHAFAIKATPASKRYAGVLAPSQAQTVWGELVLTP